MRGKAIENTIRTQSKERTLDGIEPSWISDLVLLGQFVVNKEKVTKLELQWEGPYVVAQIGKLGVSTIIVYFYIGQVKGIYFLYQIKVYISRSLS